MKRVIFTVVSALVVALSIVSVPTQVQAAITVPTCPTTSLTRTGAQTTQLKQNMSNDTWDLSGATWSDANLYGAVESDTASGTNCVKGGSIDGNIQHTWTRDCWYNGITYSGCSVSNAGDGISMRPDASGDNIVIQDTTVSDYQDAFDLQANNAGANAYLDHVQASYIGDDCFENEGSSSDPDVPVSNLYINNSFFDNCFTGFGWRPDSANSNAEGANANESFTVENSLVHIGLHPLGSNYCDSTDLADGRCQSASTSVSDSGMVGLYGLWKWSTDAPVSSNITLRNVTIKIDGQSYSSCKPWDWPTGATYDNVTVVYDGPDTYNSLCSGSTYALPTGVTLTTDTSVWDSAVTAWENGNQPPPTNTAPSVNAGSDQTVTMPDSASLDGTVSDDGLPSGSSVSTTWSQVSGPGVTVFNDASSVDTSASFSTDGTYVLKLEATDGDLTSSDTVQITVNPEPPQNTAPVVDAGSNWYIDYPNSQTLNDASVSDDGLPNGTLSILWTKVSGPGTVTFSDPTVVNPTVSFSDVGDYVLRLTADDGQLSTSDDMEAHITNNDPPSVDVGSDLDVTMPNAVTLCPTWCADDDGNPNPPGALTYSWSKASGPGTVTFADPTSMTTTATFSVDGTYVLELTVSDGALSSSDALTVFVHPAATTGVSYVGSSYAYAQSKTVTVNMPTGLQAGDVVVFQAVQNQGSGTSFSTPSGLTSMGSAASDGSSLGSQLYKYTVPSTSPKTSVTFTAGSSSVYESQVTAVAYRDVGSATLINQQVDSNTDAQHPVTGTTTSNGWNLVMAADRAYVSGGSQPSTWTPGTGLTERSDHGGHSTANIKSSMSAEASDTGTNVAAGSHTYDATASQSSSYGITALVQLVPKP